MNEVIEWLESQEGERWSFVRHRGSRWITRSWIETVDDSGYTVSQLTWEIEEYAQTDR